MDRNRVLVLTSWYFPYQVLRWEQAVTLLYQEKADRVADYDTELRSPSTVVQMPAVIKLRRSVARNKRGVKFSRLNVFARDRFCCQYCGTRQSFDELTYDHLIPRAEGGQTVWDNIVTACKPCNGKKGRRSCDEAGMFPRALPVQPKTLPLVCPVSSPARAPAEWLPFLWPHLERA